jgi:hypothetical protein
MKTQDDAGSVNEVALRRFVIGGTDDDLQFEGAMQVHNLIHVIDSFAHVPQVSPA